MNRLKTKPEKTGKKRKSKDRSGKRGAKTQPDGAGWLSNLAELFPRSSKSPFMWGLPASLESWWDEIRKRPTLAQLLDHEPSSGGPERALWALVVLHAAAFESVQPPPQALGALSTAGERWTESSETEGSQDADDADCIWADQLLKVELPLSAACLWPRDERRPGWVESAMTGFQHQVAEHLDLDGTPGEHILERWAPLVASWTRSYRLARKCRESVPESTQIALTGLVQNVLRWLRPDGSLMLGPALLEPITGSFTKYLIRMSDDPDQAKLAKRCCAQKEKAKRIPIGFPEESEQSEWGQVALLQEAWRWGTGKCAIQYSDHHLATEIGSTRTFIQGDTTPRIWIDGRETEFVGDFEQTCWHHDEEIDYIELAGDLEDDVQFYRQVVLVRGGSVMMVLDSVLLPKPATIEYQGNWPLSSAIEWQPESETTESYLKTDDGYLALLVPLSLPEWKTATRGGALVAESGSLQFRQRGDGRALCAAMAIDLDPQRTVSPRTWRQLTVAERLQTVPADIAVAFRVQLGQHQWVLYRSLGPAANRSFIGVNFADEFFIGRLRRNGRADLILQIEG